MICWLRVRDSLLPHSKYPWARYEPGRRPAMLSAKRSAMCSTRGGSEGMYITFASAMWISKIEPTLALKPRGDVTRNSKQGTSGPKIGHMCPPKILVEKKCCWKSKPILHYDHSRKKLEYLHIDVVEPLKLYMYRAIDMYIPFKFSSVLLFYSCFNEH